MPHEPLTRYRLLHQAILQGWVQSCHDLSEGGLAVALAEMSIAGRLGADVEIGDWRLESGDWRLETGDWRLETGDWRLETGEALSALEQLFSESNGRLLVEVQPDDVAHVEAHFAAVAFAQIGRVTDTQRLTIRDENVTLVDVSMNQLVTAWKRTEVAQ